MQPTRGGRGSNITHFEKTSIKDDPFDSEDMRGFYVKAITFNRKSNGTYVLIRIPFYVKTVYGQFKSY